MFKSHLGQLFYQFLRVDAFDIISIVMCACNETFTRPGGAMVARLSPVQKVACSNHSPGQLLFQFLRVDSL